MKAKLVSKVDSVKKNEILVLLKSINNDFVGLIKAGTRFVVENSTSAPKKPVNLFLLDGKGNKTVNGIKLNLELIPVYFQRTTEQLALKSHRKGAILKFTKAFKVDYQGRLITIKKDVRALVVSGGVTAILSLDQYVSGLPIIIGVSTSMIEEYLIKDDDMFDPQFNSYGIKNLQDRQGEESRCFSFDFIKGGKNIGSASNSGYGGPHRVDFIDSTDRNEFSAMVKEIASNFGLSEHSTQDDIINYFLNGYHKGFITVSRYLRLNNTN